MSILSKKMSTAASVPQSYAAFTDQFKPTHSEILELITPFNVDPLKELPNSISASRYGILSKALTPAAPSYVLGSGENQNLGYIQISPDLAKMIAGSKLGAKSSQSDTPLVLLDMILMQPVVEQVVDLFKAVLGEGSAQLKIHQRLLDVQEIAGVDDADKWVCLNLPFALKEAEDAISKDQPALDLHITMMFSALMADTLVLALGSGNDGISVDPSNPWSSHMHATVMQSKMPLKVIVEVLNMSVADCTRLELGQTIRLPGASHRQLNVSTETTGGLVDLARSTLGVSKSNKAVKLLDDIDPKFKADIETILQN